MKLIRLSDTLLLVVVYIYDWIITIDIEHRYFWSGPWTGATALFLFNRYVALLYTVYTIASSRWSIPDDQVCLKINQTQHHILTAHVQYPEVSSI